MQYLETILSIVTVILGGGWFVTYKAYKRTKNGEATQAEAEGWLKAQDMYKRTIDDLTKTCEYIAQDRDKLRQENDILRTRNNELRSKILEMDDQILELKKEISRQGRRIEALVQEKKNEKKK